MHIDRLTSEDIAAVLRLAHAAGWNQTERDIARLLALAPQGCFAARADGRVVGTATTTVYGNGLAWVGMVLVDAAFRRQGVGTALVEAALAHADGAGVATVMLDATPAGRHLYERLGFRPEGTIERWEGRLPDPRGHTFSADRSGVAALDRAAFGADRAALLHDLAADPAASAVVARRHDGEVIGYALSRPGARARYVGPVVAPDAEAARALILAASSGFGERAHYLDAVVDFPGATDLLGDLGLVRQREFIRMRRGPGIAPDGLARVFAIAGPEVG
jgi:predicted N-acetyltransferase YhbS